MPVFTPPSSYLRASDLPPDADTPVTIESYSEESLRQGEKHVTKTVLTFAGFDKGFPVNSGNGNVICQMYGAEMNDWIEKPLMLYVDPNVEYNGQRVAGIRVRRIPHKNK